mgnify:FL=1|jgi:hypothetical protein|tara:strand:+ start:1455 stop:1712 length:258 start_codon:yes stop_codon:yes gene_type:complete
MTNRTSLVALNQYLEQIKNNEQSNQVGNVNLNPQEVKDLNYEVMYSVLMTTCEQFIIKNNGNPIADELKNDILKKFGHLVSKLAG